MLHPVREKGERFPTRRQVEQEQLAYLLWRYANMLFMLLSYPLLEPAAECGKKF